MIDAHDRGTSPRARGKLYYFQVEGAPRGNIPACAGKTLGDSGHRVGEGEHPRVRGENVVDYDPLGHGVGTSPRARGKPDASMFHLHWTRNIPACAGKTKRCVSSAPKSAEHPRVRGENLVVDSIAHRGKGTSPRTRGKHPLGVGLEDQPRNIPAHAGKTLASSGSSGATAEHPRARGENPVAGRFFYPP